MFVLCCDIKLMDRYCTDGWIVAFYIVALDLISHVLGTDICR